MNIQPDMLPFNLATEHAVRYTISRHLEFRVPSNESDFYMVSPYPGFSDGFLCNVACFSDLTSLQVESVLCLNSYYPSSSSNTTLVVLVVLRCSIITPYHYFILQFAFKRSFLIAPCVEKAANSNRY